ncbi:IS3 family transposase [Sphingopyxis sp. 113P3]|uniref:IS3 family transposase n=1 Tax=Sphingopyxis sp. (strain 113P3) TaxID=292913 RepID=UPI0011873B17|nr:IS3 family transposase [Sphingopyxis sp. 113P3]
MTSTTKRRFTDEFKREAVALWETSGRMQTEVAAELGIMPTMLRRWQRKLQDSNDMPVSPAAKPPVSAIGSPADQASEIARLRRELDRARMERDILKKAGRYLCGDAAMKFSFIEQHASTWPVNVMCRMLGVSRSGYYDWCVRAPSARTTANLALLHDVRRLQARHQGRYGSPRMHAALRAEGHRCSRGRVERLMRRHRIRALAGRRFRPCTTDSRHYLPIAPNLLAQNFVATAPNRIWLADITYIATGEGWLYLAAVLDLATRKIVGWAMRDHMRTELPLAAMMMAAQRQRPDRGLICHSDRGSQYAAGAYVDHLAVIGATPSMSRTGNCYDNAPMESFFHTLKVELVHQCRWATQAEARQALFGYIEGYYNRHRMHSALGYLTPEQAEQIMTG